MRKNVRDQELSTKRLTRRSLVLGGVQALVMGGLALRMRYMQVNQADQFRTLAEENRINVRLIPPVRGLIYDRNGQVLAENEQNYRVVVVREDAGDVEETLAKLAEINRLARQTSVDGAPHALAYTHPKQVIAALQEFLREV